MRWAYHFRKQLADARRWERKFAVVVGIASADSVVAIAAESDGATIAVSGSGRLGPPTAPAGLTAQMKVRYSSRSISKLWSGPAAGYAYRALQLEPSIWTHWRSEDAKGAKLRGKAAGTRRPDSFVDWARGVDFDPMEALVQEIGPTTKPAKPVHVAELE
jgi:hypothetical protein